MKHRLLALSFLVALAPSALAQKAASIPDPHHHKDIVGSMLEDIAADVHVREVPDAPTPAEDEGAVNADKTMHAYATADENGVERVFVEDSHFGVFYEIEGLPFPNRPVSDMTWASPNLLVFDRSTNPHMGVHYVVDMKTKRLVVAALLSDEKR